MSKRQTYLVCYDIADPRRLRVVHRMVSKHAWMLQYSVYVMEATPQEVEELAQALRLRCDPNADDIRIYPLPQDVEWMAQGHDLSLLPSSGLARGLKGLDDGL